jgi:DNA-binding NtrC family response regulator
MRNSILEQLKILVVDDEVDLQEILCDELKLAGADVFSASNGADALNLIASEGPFDVILSDIRMPGGNGLDLLQEVMKLRPRPVVVLVTGYADTTEAEAKKLGAAAVLEKPFILNKIPPLILQLVSNRNTYP